MIVDGQIHGGLKQSFGTAMIELISFNEDGNCFGDNFMDSLIATAVESPDWTPGACTTPSSVPRCAVRTAAARGERRT